MSFYLNQINGKRHCDNTRIDTFTQAKSPQLKMPYWKCLAMSVYTKATEDKWLYMRILKGCPISLPRVTLFWGVKNRRWTIRYRVLVAGEVPIHLQGTLTKQGTYPLTACGAMLQQSQPSDFSPHHLHVNRFLYWKNECLKGTNTVIILDEISSSYLDLSRQTHQYMHACLWRCTVRGVHLQKA